MHPIKLRAIIPAVCVWNSCNNNLIILSWSAEHSRFALRELHCLRGLDCHQSQVGVPVVFCFYHRLVRRCASREFASLCVCECFIHRTDSFFCSKTPMSVQKVYILCVSSAAFLTQTADFKCQMSEKYLESLSRFGLILLLCEGYILLFTVRTNLSDSTRPVCRLLLSVRCWFDAKRKPIV